MTTPDPCRRSERPDDAESHIDQNMNQNKRQGEDKCRYQTRLTRDEKDNRQVEKEIVISIIFYQPSIASAPESSDPNIEFDGILRPAP